MQPAHSVLVEYSLLCRQRKLGQMLLSVKKQNNCLFEKIYFDPSFKLISQSVLEWKKQTHKQTNKQTNKQTDVLYTDISR